MNRMKCRRLRAECPVMPLAIEYDSLVRAYKNLDAGRAHPKFGDAEAEELLIWDRLDAIRTQVSYERPGSKEGAAFQLMLVNSLLDVLTDCGKRRARETRAEISRMLYAAAGYLLSDTSSPLQEASEYLMGSHIDPLARLGEIVERQ